MEVKKLPTLPTLMKKKQVAAYARVSTGKDAMLHSLSAQVSYYSAYIQKQPEWLYCGVYVDEAITGTKSERPEFQRLLSDCRAGKIDMVITKSISRFARNTVTLLETVRELKALGVDVFFEEPNIHTMSAVGEMMLTLLASVAQEESRMTSERMKWRVRKNFEEGVPWNVTILGYTLRNGRFVIVPEEAAIVRQIYDLYLSGKGYAAIADILNAADAKTRYGRVWNFTSVRWVLRNYAYTGNLLLQTTYSENHITKRMRPNTGEMPMYHAQGTHEAIIPQDVYDAVQSEIERRDAKYSDADKRRQTLLAGKVFCGICGKRCRRKKRHDRQVWICNTFNVRGKDACPAKAVPEDILMPMVDGIEIERIDVCSNNLIRITASDGSVMECTWSLASRRNSWTPEMKEKAREKYYGSRNQNTGDEEQIHVDSGVADA